MRKKNCLLALASALLLNFTPAWADFYVVAAPAGVGTPITSLPYTINNAGFYYLARDLTAGAEGIIVNVNDVTIDLMGFGLAGSGVAPGLHGINVSSYSNVEIRNGTVRNFTGDGVHSVAGMSKNRIINMRIANNGADGINLQGQKHLIQNCTVSDNGINGISIHSGQSGKIRDNVVCGNGSNGIDCTGYGYPGEGVSNYSLINNVVANNGHCGFNISYLSARGVYLFDGNTAYNNGSGSLNGIPPEARFGVNAGPGFP